MKRFSRFCYVAMWITSLTACTNQTTSTGEVTVSPGMVKGIAASHVTKNGSQAKDAGYPSDKNFQMRVLTTGNFHEDEVWKTAATENWIGLFKGENGFYLATTTITVENIHDPVVDEDETEKTGLKVSTASKDSTLLLMEALPAFHPKPIDGMVPGQNSLLPGDSLQFSYSGKAYRLFATGITQETGNGNNTGLIRQYKLYLTTTVNGKPQTQLLVAQPLLDETRIKLLFIGDVDGDSIPDFVIDTSEHYNLQKPTLYLSGAATGNEMVKPVGAHRFVGC